METKYDYHLWGGWCSEEVARPFKVSVWKYIRRGEEVFSKFVRDVGDGLQGEVLA